MTPGKTDSIVASVSCGLSGACPLNDQRSRNCPQDSQGISSKINDLLTLGVPSLVSICSTHSSRAVRPKPAAQLRGGHRFQSNVVPGRRTEAALLGDCDLNERPLSRAYCCRIPVPQGINAGHPMAIRPEKDVEGMNRQPRTSGLRRPNMPPCTAMGAVNPRHRHRLSRQNVIVRHSEIVGKPISLLLLHGRPPSATLPRATSPRTRAR